ncbi:DUF7139 domain-containing protein [Archaeoglobus profundus]|uniref:Cell division protein A N-terminal domain-containing protein n=1 Tax=Archaeoglobus profundus (strain DSM 5631 / JCM 9629 / NBRC 100127 / Av18) TaxID=572546 RepID=D2RHN6_ARCPA|nr:hypothetical protein [Archaeoglobus profundus]ADB57811.1 hypothetical protein Arcpr_0747 [Archaeoglobus profundus DSM 5631]
MRYFSNTLIFVVGLGLIVLGLVFIVYFQLHYGSEPTLVKTTFSLVGLGVPLAVQGIAGMLGYVKYSRATGLSGFLLCVLGLLAFLYLYPKGWIYPTISIVATIYALGLILVLGGLFAEVVQRIIESKPVTVSREISKKASGETPEFDESVFLEPVKFPEPEITFKDIETGDIKFGKALNGRIGKVVKVKDNVDYDATLLNRVKDGKLEIKVKDDEISKISKILKDMESRMKKD